MAYPYGPNLELPNSPTQYTNPLLMKNLENQSTLANNLTSGNFSGDLSWLKGLIDPNSGYLQNALTAAQGTLQPQFRDTLQQITNNAASAGSLNSSTFTDALAKAGSDLNSQYQSMVGNAAMQDYTNANNNRLSLFGSGLQLGQQGISNQMSQGNSTNEFNLANYGNIVAKAIQDNSNLQQYPSLNDVLSKLNLGGNSAPTGTGFGSGLGSAPGSIFGGSSNTYGTPNAVNALTGEPTFNATPFYSGPGAPISTNSYNGSYTGSYIQPTSGFTFSAPKPNALASNNPFGKTNTQYGTVNTAWNPSKAVASFK